MTLVAQPKDHKKEAARLYRAFYHAARAQYPLLQKWEELPKKYKDIWIAMAASLYTQSGTSVT